MSPKEKAKELLHNYVDLEVSYTCNGLYIEMYLPTETAKQCALICVDEIIDNTLKFDPSIEYWKQVKQELEKL